MMTCLLPWIVRSSPMSCGQFRRSFQKNINNNALARWELGGRILGIEAAICTVLMRRNRAAETQNETVFSCDFKKLLL